MEQGKVKWFDDQKGYGFIEQEFGDDLFVHYSDIQQEGYKTLSEDQVVEFEIEETEKGLAAKNVSVVSDDTEPAAETEEEEEEEEEEDVEEFSIEEETQEFSMDDDL